VGETIMTKSEILEHPDFEKLVKAAIARFSLKRKMVRLDLDLTDVVHMVRCYVWTRDIRENIELSTIIYAFTRYVIMEEISRRKRNTDVQEDDNHTVACHRSTSSYIEAADMIDRLRKQGYSKEVDICLAFENRNSYKEMAKMLGKNNRQRVDQVKSRSYKILRLAVDKMGIE